MACRRSFSNCMCPSIGAIAVNVLCGVSMTTQCTESGIEFDHQIASSADIVKTLTVLRQQISRKGTCFAFENNDQNESLICNAVKPRFDAIQSHVTHINENAATLSVNRVA
jgi:hypothetical protein